MDCVFTRSRHVHDSNSQKESPSQCVNPYTVRYCVGFQTAFAQYFLLPTVICKCVQYSIRCLENALFIPLQISSISGSYHTQRFIVTLVFYFFHKLKRESIALVED